MNHVPGLTPVIQHTNCEDILPHEQHPYFSEVTTDEEGSSAKHIDWICIGRGEEAKRCSEHHYQVLSIRNGIYEFVCRDCAGSTYRDASQLTLPSLHPKEIHKNHKCFYKFEKPTRQFYLFKCDGCNTYCTRFKKEFWDTNVAMFDLGSMIEECDNKYGIVLNEPVKTPSRWSKIKDALLGGGYFRGQ